MSGAATRLAACDTCVLDVDNFLYPASNGLRDFINSHAAAAFNHLTRKGSQRKEARARFRLNLERTGQQVADILSVRPAEVNAAFPAMVQTGLDLMPDRLPHYLDALYGNRYDLIARDEPLVEAFTRLRDNGTGIFLYTSGASARQAGQDFHVQHVLRALGCADDMVDYLRGRTFDILNALAAGHSKSTRESMQDFVSFSGIKPRRAFMGDDKVRNLVPAVHLGMQALWGCAEGAAPDLKDVLIAKTLDAPRTTRPGKALLKVAQLQRA